MHSLKCTQIRARVEKVDVLGWKKSSYSITPVCSFFIKHVLVLKITSSALCEDSSMFVSSITVVKKYKFSLNEIILFVDISCFNSVTRLYIYEINYCKKIQNLTGVDKEMVAIMFSKFQ